MRDVVSILKKVIYPEQDHTINNIIESKNGDDLLQISECNECSSSSYEESLDINDGLSVGS